MNNDEAVGLLGAWHGDEAVKASFISQVKHRRNFRPTEKYRGKGNHEKVLELMKVEVQETNLPLWLFLLMDECLRVLPKACHKSMTLIVFKAIPVGLPHAEFELVFKTLLQSILILHDGVVPKEWNGDAKERLGDAIQLSRMSMHDEKFDIEKRDKLLKWFDDMGANTTLLAAFLIYGISTPNHSLNDDLGMRGLVDQLGWCYQEFTVRDKKFSNAYKAIPTWVLHQLLFLFSRY